MIVPVGFPEAALTAAVNVTACPYTDGLNKEASVVVVEAWGPVLFSSTPTLPEPPLAKMRSGKPSPFTSATATDRGDDPPEP